MERRSFPRHACSLGSLILTYGCHFSARISDWSEAGIRLTLHDCLPLRPLDHCIIYCDGFNVVHAKVIWTQGRELGACICNPKTAALGAALYLLQEPAANPFA